MANKTREFEKLDLAFENFLDGIFLEHIETDFTEEKKAERRASGDHDDLAFCETYFPQIFYLPWNDLHKFVSKLSSGMWTLSGFRKSGKSAFVYVAKAIKHICLRKGGIVNINCDTLLKSKARTAALKRIMFRNRLLVYDYDLELMQDREGHYIINNTQMIAQSVQTGLRNLVDDEFKRIRIAINDDLYDKDSVTSELQNRKVVDFIESEVRGQLEDDGLSITMGNSISHDCPIVTLKESHPEKSFSLPAIDDDGKSTWPQYKTAEQWEAWRDTENVAWDIWLGEYMDSPSLKGGVFEPEFFREIFTNTLKILATVSAADPAHGESLTSCYKSIATVSMVENGEQIVEDIYLRREDYTLFFDYVDALRARYPHWKVLLFENDFSQWHMAQPYYDAWCKTRNKTLPVVRHLTSELATAERGTDKDSRIMNLFHPLQTGKMQFRQGVLQSVDGKIFKQQLLSFGKSKTKLDGPDAMATAAIMVRRYIETGGFKPLKQRQFFKEVQQWLRGGSSFR